MQVRTGRIQGDRLLCLRDGTVDGSQILLDDTHRSRIKLVTVGIEHPLQFDDRRVVLRGDELGPRHRVSPSGEQIAKHMLRGERRKHFFNDEEYAQGLGFRGILVPGPMLSAFLEQVSLVADIDLWEDAANAVSIPFISTLRTWTVVPWGRIAFWQWTNWTWLRTWGEPVSLS